MKKILSILLLISLLGCSSSTPSGTAKAIELPDPLETLEKANETMANIKSMSMDCLVEMVIRVGGKETEAFVEMDMDIETSNKGGNIHVDMTSYSDGEEEAISFTYVDGIYYFESDGQKYRMTMDVSELGTSVKYEDMNISYSNMETMVFDDYIKVTIKPTNEEIMNVINDFGDLSESSGINKELIDELTKIECNEYNVYIDHDGYVICQTFGFYAAYESNSMEVNFKIKTEDINNTKVEIKNKDKYFNLDPYL